MIKKRLIGTAIVKNGWAAQSFGYNKYLSRQTVNLN